MNQNLEKRIKIEDWSDLRSNQQTSTFDTWITAKFSISDYRLISIFSLNYFDDILGYLQFFQIFEIKKGRYLVEIVLNWSWSRYKEILYVTETLNNRQVNLLISLPIVTLIFYLTTLTVIKTSSAQFTRSSQYNSCAQFLATYLICKIIVVESAIVDRQHRQPQLVQFEMLTAPPRKLRRVS